jgi:formylglycine-generating enzyme required for sulfatase activity
MGCDAGEWNCEEDERPAHRVWLPAFDMDRHEVTVAQYRVCVEDRSCTAAGADSDNCNASHSDRDDHPVNCVTWFDAKSYCAWQQKRLPSEAEWEKAARGTKQAMFPWGAAPATCERAIMSFGSGNGCDHGSTWPVGSRPTGASPYGAEDMAGNVWEWVEDWFVAGYASTPLRNPLGPATGTERVIRSGSWDDAWAEKAMRTVARSSNGPDTHGGHLGFRCARSF